MDFFYFIFTRALQYLLVIDQHNVWFFIVLEPYIITNNYYSRSYILYIAAVKTNLSHASIDAKSTLFGAK